jgi:hypothetical protein
VQEDSNSASSHSNSSYHCAAGAGVLGLAANSRGHQRGIGAAQCIHGCYNWKDSGWPIRINLFELRRLDPLFPKTRFTHPGRQTRQQHLDGFAFLIDHPPLPPVRLTTNLVPESFSELLLQLRLFFPCSILRPPLEYRLQGSNRCPAQHLSCTVARTHIVAISHCDQFCRSSCVSSIFHLFPTVSICSHLNCLTPFVLDPPFRPHWHQPAPNHRIIVSSQAASRAGPPGLPPVLQAKVCHIDFIASCQVSRICAGLGVISCS